MKIREGIISQLLPTLSPSPPDVEALRAYLILPFYHEFINSKNYKDLHTVFGRSVLNLTKVPLSIVSQWWAQQSIEYFEKLIENYKNVVMHILNYKFPKTCLNEEANDENAVPRVHPKYEFNLDTALKMLKLLYQINRDQREQRVSYETFYLNGLTEIVHLQTDFCEWVKSKNQVCSSKISIIFECSFELICNLCFLYFILLGK